LLFPACFPPGDGFPTCLPGISYLWVCSFAPLCPSYKPRPPSLAPQFGFQAWRPSAVCRSLSISSLGLQLSFPQTGVRARFPNGCAHGSPFMSFCFSPSWPPRFALEVLLPSGTFHDFPLRKRPNNAYSYAYGSFRSEAPVGFQIASRLPQRRWAGELGGRASHSRLGLAVHNSERRGDW